MIDLKKIAIKTKTSIEIIEAISEIFKIESEDSLLIILDSPSEKESQMILEKAWSKTLKYYLLWESSKIERS